jgi:hypothetical protein
MDLSLEGNRMLARIGKYSLQVLFLLLVSATCVLWTAQHAWCAEETEDMNNTQANKDKTVKEAELALYQAVMCETVQNLKPINEAVTFSVSLGHVYCLSYFKPVLKPSVIFHRWYRRNELSTQIRLKVYPPHWATYSVIQLREEDKGPWHIEVTDQNGKVFDVLRFSITD